jgi:RNA polymerase sigma factor (sigma-70 family)
VLLVVWQNAEQFQHESRFSTWGFGIASCLARKARTRALSRKTKLAYPVSDRPSTDDPAVALEQQEQMRTLSYALSHLPDHLQETLRLKYDRGYTYQQIAHELGCSSETVKQRLKKGR